MPSQINLLPVGAGGVVVNFILADGGGGGDKRKLSYFNVEFKGLEERTAYEYRVSSAEGSKFSPWSSFTSLYTKGETKFAMYADMGLFGSSSTDSVPSAARHNIGNVLDDVLRGDVDFIVHSGDHAYEFEVNGGARGDGYMDQYSDVLSRAPWIPGWGNHEYLEMDRGDRLGNITGGLINALNQDRMHYSMNLGMAHIVQLDLSPYYCNFEGCYGVDTCGFPDKWLDDLEETGNFQGYREELLEWLESDLEGVDRSKTPWVIVTSHFPMYDTTDYSVSSSLLDKDLGASGKVSFSSFSSGSVVPSRELATSDIEPLLLSHSVDVYFCGHNHNYETTWPVFNGTATQKDFVNPKAPVHILAGSAGPPETDQFTAESPEWSREPRLTDNSYSRVNIKNSTHMFYEQVKNDDGSILDSFVIAKQ
ncbi:hypothetical protein TrRE_jg3151 [Triparma retinervis]|uniref:Purple acid phosphatase n=1 Tax=Triparma retinervis TaxID=2557542 RepID=A0A9W7FWA3_9STRA|nr:hypothetical protein TrRE_jg3151 [Triparma retinervis]